LLQSTFDGQTCLHFRDAHPLHELLVEAHPPRSLPILFLPRPPARQDPEGVVGMLHPQSAGGLLDIYAGHPEINQQVLKIRAASVPSHCPLCWIAIAKSNPY
jgi:hypothetical protein